MRRHSAILNRGAPSSSDHFKTSPFWLLQAPPRDPLATPTRPCRRGRARNKPQGFKTIKSRFSVNYHFCGATGKFVRNLLYKVDDYPLVAALPVVGQRALAAWWRRGRRRNTEPRRQLLTTAPSIAHQPQNAARFRPGGAAGILPKDHWSSRPTHTPPPDRGKAITVGLVILRRAVLATLAAKCGARPVPRLAAATACRASARGRGGR